jgi:2-dehydropantoate 2-reductase
MLLAVGFRYRRLKSSMLGALERGRPPAVEFLNGEVVERGQQHGISTPVNASVRELVWAIARKEAAPGIPLIRELFEKTAFLRGPEQR